MPTNQLVASDELEHIVFVMNRLRSGSRLYDNYIVASVYSVFTGVKPDISLEFFGITAGPWKSGTGTLTMPFPALSSSGPSASVNCGTE